MRHTNLNRLEYFVAIVEAGTITAAAQAMGVSKAVVSKQLQLLEEEVDATLVLRNSRHQSLTEDGEALYKAAKPSLSQVEEALEEIRSGRDAPSGNLRVAAPLDLGLQHVAPFAAEFRRTHPAVSIDLRLSDTRHDPVASRFDVAYRVGWLADSSNRTRKLMEFQQILVGTPDVLKAIGPVAHPHDLTGAPFIAHEGLENPLTWRMTHQDGAHQDIVFDQGLSTDVTIGVKSMCLAGAGLAVLPSYEVWDDLASGQLRSCAPDWRLPSGGIFAVYPPTSYRSAATRYFDRDFTQHLRVRLK